MHSSSAITPVFVVGAPHSGTTILYKMLAYHPAATWFSQYSLRDGSVPGHRPIPLSRHLDQLLRRVFSHDWRKQDDTWLERLLVPAPIGAVPIWNYVLPAGASLPPEESVRRLRQVFETHCWQSGKKVILAKLPRLTWQIPVLLAAYPATRLVHIVRDGRAMALSMRRKLQRHGESDSVALQQAAERWTEALRQVNADPGSVFELRYEDFCRDVPANLTAILQYLGWEPAAMPRRYPPALQISNPRRLRSAQPGEMSMLEDIQRDWLQHYHYL